MDLKNKVALVTGGSSGIGQAIVLKFAEQGAKIAFSYRENRNGADNVVSKIEKNIVSFQADLTMKGEGQRLVESSIDRFGRLDILVNNAGRYISGDEWNGEISVWEKSIKQNFISVLEVSKFVISMMQKQKSGVIVNIASRYSVSGQYDAATYSAAKAGIINLTQAQAKLIAPWGRANAISPGVVRAGYWLKASKEELNENVKNTLLQKMIEPEDIADAVLFLASSKARMITGQNLVIDGGYSLK